MTRVPRFSLVAAQKWAVTVLLLFLVLGCGEGSGTGEKAGTPSKGEEPVRIVYVDWASERASAHVVQAVLEERMGRECRLLDVTLIAMWQALAAGDQDASVAAWLPTLQARFLERHRSEVVNLGPNLEGTRIGIVVPEYVSVDSIAELSGHADRFRHKIIGIDPHAGITEKTKEALQAYDLDAFDLVTGSGPTMTAALGEAMRNREWIAVTGWTPHWKFARWDLKYLEDPRGVYGGKEHISTIVRQGLKEDMPRVYSFLDRFHWTPEEMARVMLTARDEETSYAQAAREWVEENEARVSAWLDE